MILVEEKQRETLGIHRSLASLLHMQQRNHVMSAFRTNNCHATKTRISREKGGEWKSLVLYMKVVTSHRTSKQECEKTLRIYHGVLTTTHEYNNKMQDEEQLCNIHNKTGKLMQQLPNQAPPEVVMKGPTNLSIITSFAMATMILAMQSLLAPQSA